MHFPLHSIARLWQSTGFKPSRLVYVGGETPEGPAENVHGPLVDAERRLQRAEEAAKRAKEAAEGATAQYTELIRQYNEAFTDKDYNASNPLHLYEKPLADFKWKETEITKPTINVADEASIIANYPGIAEYLKGIDEIMGSRKETWSAGRIFSANIATGEIKSLREAEPDQYRALEGFKDNLLTIPAKLKANIDAEKARAEAAAALVTLQTETLAKSMREAKDHEDIQEELKERPGYTTLESQYTLAVEGLLKDREFKSFWENDSGQYSAYRERENRTLFLSILRENTNEFNDDFPFPAEGPQAFDEDPDVNRTNYPFLHNEWMKKKCGKGVIDTIAKLQADINQLTPLTAEAIASLAFTTNPAITEARDAETAEKRADEIATEQRIIRAKISDGTITATDKDTWENPTTGKIAKLEKHKQLAEKLAKWYKEKEVYDKAHADFRRSVLRDPENHFQQTVMEFTLRQYRRASQLVDQAFERGAQGAYLHPATRRMLIAMVYQKGVGAKYEEAVAGALTNYPTYVESDNDYNAVIEAIVRQSQFNTAHKGRFLDQQQIDILDLATSARTPNEVAFIRNYLNGPAEYARQMAAARAMEEGSDKDAAIRKADEYIESITKTFDRKLILRNLEKSNDPTKVEWAGAFRRAEAVYNQTMATAEEARTAAYLEAERVHGINLADHKADRDTGLVHAANEVQRAAVREAGRLRGETIAAAQRTLDAVVADLVVTDKAPARAQFEREKAEAQRIYDEAVRVANEALKAAKERIPAEAGRLRDAAKRAADAALEAAKTAALTPFKTAINKPDAANLDAVYTALEEEGRKAEPYEHFQDINYTFISLERAEKSDSNFLEVLGIQTEGLYEAYSKYAQEHPDLVVDEWLNLYNSDDPKQFEKLVACLTEIVPEAEGKKSFLAVFATLRQFSPLTPKPGEEPAEADPRMAALTIFNTLRRDIERHNTVSKDTESADAEYRRRIEENLSVGDRVTEYGRSVINMLIGPGQSLANRAAGAALLFMAYKAIRKAFGSNPGAGGTALRWAAIVAAADVVIKRQTGRGAFERVGLMKEMTAVEGTYDAALVKFSEKERDEEKISESQHMRALHELNKVPFKKTVEWYEWVRKNRNQVMPKEGDEDPFKDLGIDAEYVFNNEQKFNEKKDPEVEGRRITFQTIEWFLKYMGHKESGDVDAGLRLAKNIYLDPLYRPDDPSLLSPERMRYSTRANPILRDFQTRPDELTWGIVVASEVSLEDVEATRRQNIVDKTVDTVADAYNSTLGFIRREIISPASYEAREFFRGCGDYAGAAKEWGLKMAEKGADKVHFTKDKMVLWYGENKIELERLFDAHVELVKNGIVLPFKIIIGIDQALVPFVNVKLRQAEAILRDKYGQREMPFGTLRGDLAPDFFAASNEVASEYLGERYRDQFRLAFENNNFHLDKERIVTRAEDEEHNLSEANVAYFITPIELEESEKSMPVRERLRSMHARGWEIAKETFLKKIGTLPDPNPYNEAFFKKYLYPITAVSKIGGDGIQPEQLYVFWRMPTVNSPEYLLREDNKWANYDDPRKMKDVPPFITDPSKSLWENLVMAFGPDLQFLKPELRFAGKFIAQWIRVANYVLEKGAGTLETLGGAVQIPAKYLNWLKKVKLTEEQKIAIDEALSSATNDWTAISAFYGAGAYTDAAGKTQKIDIVKAARNRETYKKAHHIEDKDHPNTEIVDKVTSGVVNIPKGTDYFVGTAQNCTFNVYRGGRLTIGEATGTITINLEKGHGAEFVRPDKGADKLHINTEWTP